MAISKITTRGMSGDTLEAGDIAANAIGASELADNAVDTAAIAATSITEAKLNADVTDGSAIQTGVKPHIQPGTLYPAWSGLLTENTSGTFTDSSASARAITPTQEGLPLSRINGVHHSGTQKKVGSTALRFDGVDDYLSMADSADFHYAAGSFTIEFWMYIEELNHHAHGVSEIYYQGTASNDMIEVMVEDDGLFRFLDYSSGAYTINISLAAGTFTTGQWYHVAIVRNATPSPDVWYVFKDGVAQTITWNSSTTVAGTLADHGAPLFIGECGYDSGDRNFKGFLDEFRIVKGTAVYTGNFTPPTALTATGGTYSSGTNVNTSITSGHTKLLIHSDAGGHSGAYGTAQSDGRKYYYTDIRGSKPIKDPRIGTYFGSQRYKFSSLQFLEQETNLQNENVYTVDGREYIRYCGRGIVGQTAHGNRIESSNQTQDFYEIVGYFSSATVSAQPRGSGERGYRTQIDGGAESAANNSYQVGYDSPLVADRYVDASSVVSLSINETLGIHTLKLKDESVADAPITHGVELIAQDTTSTANRSKIQIPSQNVVSYGKKFSINAATPHYDPFNGFTSGNLAAVQALIDTDTSLGMSHWLSGSTYYRPFNGGRVVKWVDSSGTIKTSVTMMPPNAQNYSGNASNAHTLGNANDNAINFDASLIDQTLAEVAKDFMIREFGNGSANGVSNNTYEDLSTLNSNDARAYCMDDGLTNMMVNEHRYSSYAEGLHRNSSSGKFFLSFIGTGIGRTFSTTGASTQKRSTWAQNLPYGTHILSSIMDGADSNDWFLDGIQIYDNSAGAAAFHNVGQEVKIFQPKMPPIPDDACIIGDYMLMADFVRQTDAEFGQISKGVRFQSASRDVYYGSSGDWTAHGHATLHNESPFGLRIHTTSGAATAKLPFFGTTSTAWGESTHIAGWAMTLGGSAATETLLDNSVTGYADAMTIAETVALGLTDTVVTFPTSYNFFGIAVASPTHTSSHYQAFETPYLKELVGGDRNMEQTNLVVTADGKTWDEVTRDTSYIGNWCFQARATSANVSGSWDANVTHSLNLIRGVQNGLNMHNKDWAIAYNQFICLVDGEYDIRYIYLRDTSTGNASAAIYINGTNVNIDYTADANHRSGYCQATYQFKRGDYFWITGSVWGGQGCNLSITRTAKNLN